MHDRISADLVVSFIKQAIAPHECHVEFADYQNQVSFAVYFEHRDRFVSPVIYRKTFQHKDALDSALQAIRADLEAQGEKLSPWLGIPDLTDC